MGIPLITGDSPAARELLHDGENAILCEMDNSQALADAILRLQSDPQLRRRIGAEGRRLFETRCSTRSVGSHFAAHIAELLDRESRVTH
jgi:glycosyltransferase involved in cell wall biosynthesis